jgi:hypothetical protein
MKNICAGCYIGSECGVMTMAQTQVIAVERTASVNRKDAIAGWRCGTFWNDAEESSGDFGGIAIIRKYQNHRRRIHAARSH